MRPVTASGHAAAGFTVKRKRLKKISIYCNSPSPSPVSVSKNVELCSPSAAYAVACWNAATPHRVLCEQDPRTNKVVSFRRTGKFARTAAISARQLAPMVLVLRDGKKCFIRDGGAWGTLKGHPKWGASYGCTARHGGTVVWARQHSAHEGVNETHPVWTVHVSNGRSKLRVKRVAKAYFVGTAD